MLQVIININDFDEIFKINDIMNLIDSFNIKRTKIIQKYILNYSAKAHSLIKF